MKLTFALLMTTLLLLSSAALAEELEYGMGCIIEPEMPPWVQPSPPIKLEREIDTSCDNSSHFPPIGNQGSQGSCVAWATAYYYKTYQEWEEHAWAVNLNSHQFSPAFTYNLINGGVNEGSTISDAFKLFGDIGCATMADMPYITSNWTNFPDESDFLNAMNYRTQRTTYAIYLQTDLQDLKNYLLNGHVAVCAISVYGNFSNIAAYNYNYCVSQVYGNMLGYHAVTFCGFDDARQTADGVGAFKMANSWGTNWGQSGYWWMSYQAAQNGITCWGYAYYLDDLVNYTPTCRVRYRVTHGDRYALDYQIGLGSHMNPTWARSFFDFQMGSHAHVAYPSSNIVLDLTDLVPSLNPYGPNNVFIRCYDESNLNGMTGNLTYYAVEQLTWPLTVVCSSTPVFIPENNSFAYADVDLAGTPVMTVDITPQNPPIQIPAGGGNFQYDIRIENVSSQTMTFDVWTMITRPDGLEAGPYLFRQDLTRPAGGVIERFNLSQSIPASAATGNYSFTARVGQYPDTVYALDAFSFEKAAAANAGSGSSGWAFSAWDEGSATRSGDPNSFTFNGARPNPFNPTTALSYQLSAFGFVNLKVYDTAGRLVATLVDGWREAGEHQITFDASDFPSGVYLARLTAEDHVQVQKLVLAK